MDTAPAATHTSIELHFPSRDRHGHPIDRQPWVELAIETMCHAFGGAYEETVMGYWMGETRTCLREETSRIVSYAREDQIRQALPRLLDIVRDFIEKTDQEMALVAVDDHPHLIPAVPSPDGGCNR